MKFSPEHEAFRASVRKFVEKECAPYVDDWEAEGIFPAHEVFKKAGALGILGVEYDPEYGGMGGDHLFAMIASEELGRMGCGGVPMAFGVQMMMATPSRCIMPMANSTRAMPGRASPNGMGSAMISARTTQTRPVTMSATSPVR